MIYIHFKSFLVFTRHVIGLDVDAQSLEIASVNADELEVLSFMVLLLCLGNL